MSDRWPDAAKPDAQLRLVLDEPPAARQDHPQHDISAAARVGDTLFLAADECASLEVLQLEGDAFTGHRRFALSQFFELPDGDEEVDLEGLAVDDGWLWIVGSHSLTRKKPKKGRPLDEAAIEKLAQLKDNDNRMFLGRLPLREAEQGVWEVCEEDSGGRRPQMLPIGKHGSRLDRRLREDPLLAPFCVLPAKENGVDIEGIVVDGRRVGLGLRGPVINGWAIVLELEVRADGEALKVHGHVKKHVLDLGGLGIRDLKRRGDEVIVLAGPTMKLDGPAQVFRWTGWANPPQGSDLLQRPERMLELPYGCGCDHPEALALAQVDGHDALLVVCDSPGGERLKNGAVLADVFRYPS